LIMEAVPSGGCGCVCGSWSGDCPVLAAAPIQQVHPWSNELWQAGMRLQHWHDVRTASSMLSDSDFYSVLAALVFTASSSRRHRHRSPTALSGVSQRLPTRLHLRCQNTDTDAATVDGIIDGSSMEEPEELEEDEERYEVSERELRWLQSTLDDQTVKQLKQMCTEIDEPAPPKAKKRQVLHHLCSPPVRAKALAFLKLAEGTKPSLSPNSYKAVLAAMASSNDERYVPLEALREAKNAGEHRQSQPWLVPSEVGQRSGIGAGGDGVDYDDGDQFPRLFEPKYHSGLDTVQPRKTLESMQVGDEITGRIAGLSLYDGMRVDVGAEFDALVPASFAKDEQLTNLVATSFPLGTEVNLRLLEVHKGPGSSALRFPLVAELLDSRWPSNNNEGINGKSLVVDAGSDLDMLHELRGTGTPSPGMGAAASVVGGDAQTPAGSGSLQWEDVRNLPPRSPREDVLTFGTDNDVQLVDVPQDHKSDTVEAEKAAAAAWGHLALDELGLVGYELRCRDRFAADLDTVEMDLAAGRPPSVPTALLGLTPAGPSRQCLPFIDKDKLSFRFIVHDRKEQLLHWIEDVEHQHECTWQSWRPGLPDSAAVQQETKQLRRIFECVEVCRVRAIYRVGAMELKRYPSLAKVHQFPQEALKVSTQQTLSETH